jgi:WYL_2, Sm-like SH3 beta-barrel fold
MTKDEIIAALKSETVKVTFIKADDTVREMNCTLQFIFLPSRSEEKRIRTMESDDVISVWDTNKGAWRSFQLDSILRMDFANGTEWINNEMYEVN